jgi:hypothetical protein
MTRYLTVSAYQTAYSIVMSQKSYSGDIVAGIAGKKGID